MKKWGWILIMCTMVVGQVRAEELLRDTKFANGFGTCFWLGKDYNPGPEVLKKGLCSSYINTPGKTVKTIPDDPNKSVLENNRNKFWEFNDGIHQNFINSQGQQVSDLLIHRMAINREIEIDDPAALVVSQKNLNGDIVKKVATNKNGKIYVYYNSKNEIRNVANKYDASFANDVWPTFQLDQNFENYIDLAKYETMKVSLDARIIKWASLPGWPETGKPGISPQEMSLNIYTFIRRKDNPLTGMFVGMAIYSSDPNVHYQPYSNLDQFGQGFFRDDVRLYGGPAADGAEAAAEHYKKIEFDLLALIDKALQDVGSTLTHKDFDLSTFSFGEEGMGWFETEYDIKNLSMEGKVKSELKGFLEAVSCEGIIGWVGDKGQPSKKVPVHIYYDGSHLLGATTANLAREEAVCNELGSNETPCRHGFVYELPNSLKDGQKHTIDVYGIRESGNNPKLVNSGKVINCSGSTGGMVTPATGSNQSGNPKSAEKIKTTLGDGNGDEKTDLVDFSLWKQEYLGKVNTKNTDFNKDGKVDLVDFGEWKDVYEGGGL